MSLNTSAIQTFENAPSHVGDIFGPPRKSIIKLSVPIITALVFGALNNIVDLIWVSGLGVDALSAVGFCIPISMIVLALSTGLGTGGGALIAQRIGSKDKEGADGFAAHTMILMVMVALVFSVPVVFYLKPILIFIGAGEVVDLSLSYGRLLFGGMIIFFFNEVASSILDSEGNVTSVMKVIATASLLNVILDPIFIYLLDLGLEGAAIATLLGGLFANLIFFHRLFFSTGTYVSIPFRTFTFNRKHAAAILLYGLPISISGFTFALMTFAMNFIVNLIGGAQGIAVFSTGMRIVFISLLPMMGITSAVTTMVSVAFGENHYKKIDLINNSGIKVGLIVEGCIALTTFVLAPYIAKMFTWSQTSAIIRQDLILFLRIMACVYVSAPFARASIGAFIGFGKSHIAMIVALMRAIVVIPPAAYMCGTYLGMGLSGIWVGLVAGNWLVALTTFFWAKLYIKRISSIPNSKNHE